jgi:uncharacterized protein
VRYPDLPDPFDPQPAGWLTALRAVLAEMSGERVVLCHSLACLLWMLHARDREAAGSADRVLLVAPPCRTDVPAIPRFWPTGVDAAALERAAPATLTVCSDDDPYCPATAERAFPGMFTSVHRIAGGAHLNTDAGYGPWPWVEEWALGR